MPYEDEEEIETELPIEEELEGGGFHIESEEEEGF